MISTHIRKIIRDALAHKLRTSFVIFSVFIGVLGTVILSTMGQLLVRQLEKDLIPSEMAMLRVYLTTNSEDPIDNEQVLEDLAGQPGVTAVEGQAAYELLWRSPEEVDFQIGDLFAYSQPLEDTSIEPLRLVEGEYPDVGELEVVIEKRMADKTGLAIGDSIVVSQGIGVQQTWTIVGIVFQPYIYFGDKDPEDNLYAHYEDAQTLLGFEGYSSMYVRFRSFNTARQQSYSFRQAVNNDTPYQIVFHLLDNPRNNAMLVGAYRFRNVLLALAIISTLVASFLVINIVNMMISEQQRQIGVMKSLGAGKVDIYVIYLGTVFMYGFLGTLPGLLIGIPIGKEAARLIAPLANTFLTDTHTPLLPIMLALGLGIGVPFLAALVPIVRGTRITILKAINDRGIESGFGKGLIPVLMNRLPLPMSATQAINNLVRRKGRLLLTFISLTLAVAAFMGMYATFYSLNRVLSDIRERLNYDVSLDLSQVAVRDIVEGFMAAEQSDGILAISPGVAVELKVDPSDTPADPPEDEIGFPIVITAVETTADLPGLEFESGTGWQDDAERNGIVITPQMAQQYDKEVGDRLLVHSPEEPRNLEIIGIASYPVETAFMRWQELEDFVGIVRDAPTPNAYWENVQVDNGERFSTWALGVDEETASYLSPGFSTEARMIAISKSLAETYGLQVGDVVTLASLDGDLFEDIEHIVSDGEFTFTIVDVLDLSDDERQIILQNAPPEVDPSKGIIAMYWAHLAEATGHDDQSFYPNTFRIDLTDPLASVAVNTEEAASTPNFVYDDEVGFADRVVQTVVSIGVVMNVSSMLMAIVGAIGLLTITLMNVWERQREIGVMRSVGATNRDVFIQFLLEGIIVGVIAWLVGIPISYLLSQYLTDAVPFHEVITFQYTLLAPLLGFVGIILVTTLAVIYPAWQASRRTVSDILRYL